MSLRILYPAIDLLGGRAVRLHKGERSTAKVYSDDPPALAYRFAREGARWIHVVDLDAAFGEPRQFALIERIAKAALRGGAFIQVGGGLRDLDAIEATLGAAERVILGTAALEQPELLREALGRYRDRIAVGIDVKDGRVAVRGWTESSGPLAGSFSSQLYAAGVRNFVVTAVARDGTLGGFDLELLRAVAAAAPEGRIIASGGAGSLEHLRRVARLPNLGGAIAGTALYEGNFTLGEAQRALGEAPRWLAVRGEYAVSDNPDTLEPGTIHTFLEGAYWSQGIPLETVTRAIDGSLNFSLVHFGGENPRQVGYVRVITDRATFAYVCDVFVLPAHRGHGLAGFMMDAVQAHPDLQGLRRWLLFTRDSHSLYARSGFKPLAKPDRAMEKIDPDIYQPQAKLESAAATAPTRSSGPAPSASSPQPPAPSPDHPKGSQ